MSVTRQDVERIAALARLALGPEERERMARELGRILEHVERMRGLDLSAVEPTSHVLDLETPLRPDLVRPGLGRDEALYNAPEADGGLFVVPKVIQER